VDRVNENQGAESSLSFLLSLLEMRAAHAAAPVRRPHPLLAGNPYSPQQRELHRVESRQ
jgi:hypothetical protein